MRHTTFLLLSISLGTQAQVNFPFPDSDATWVQYYEVMVSPPPLPTFEWQTTANFCMDGSDTLLLGQSYTKLAYCQGGYVGGIRVEDGAVLFFPADSLQEYLLYDFTVQLGDTLHDVYVNEELGIGTPLWMNAGLVDMVVSAVGPQPDYDDRIVVQADAFEIGTGTNTTWIEGIGCLHGLFTYNPVNISGYWYGIDCMSYLDTTYWNSWYTNEPGSCAPLYVGLSEKSMEEVLVYPNPTTGSITLATGHLEHASIQVFDAAGRDLEIPKRVLAEGLSLDLCGLVSGMYTVVVSGPDGRYAVRVIRE